MKFPTGSVSSRSATAFAPLAASVALLAGVFAYGVPALASHSPDPSSVTVAGSLQDELDESTDSLDVVHRLVEPESMAQNGIVSS